MAPDGPSVTNTASTPRSLVELRLLDGPNLYFPQPAAKVTLDLTELLDAVGSFHQAALLEANQTHEDA